MHNNVHRDHQWAASSHTKMYEIFSDENIKLSEFVTAEIILVWLTKKEGYTNFDRHFYRLYGRIARPFSVQNSKISSDVIDCIRPAGLSLFYNLLVLIPWMNRIGVQCPHIENFDYDSFEPDEDDVTESDFCTLTNARKTAHPRAIGHTTTTILPKEVITLQPGVYIIDEPCQYCGSEENDELDTPLSMVRISVIVDPEEQPPVRVSGRCYPVDGRQEFYHHTVEHCVLDPKASLLVSDEFVSLYCASYASLYEHLRRLKARVGDEILLYIFYSLR